MSRNRVSGLKGILAGLFLLFRAALPACANGAVIIAYAHGLFSIDAQDASLADVFKAINAHLGEPLLTAPEEERRVTTRVYDVALEDLLSRLGVNYALTYRVQRDGTAVPEAARFFTTGHGLTGRALVASYIAQLADDNVRFNAQQYFWKLAEMGATAIPELERALGHPDYQTRQFAACLLCRLGAVYTPSPRFLEEVVAGLQDDQFPSGVREDGSYFFTDLNNARAGYEYFQDHKEAVDLAEPFLGRALYSEDGQQRLLSAALLASRGKTIYTPTLVQVLLPHLCDNDLTSDAGLAAQALARLGESARPYLQAAVHSPDKQQAMLVELLLQRLDTVRDESAETAVASRGNIQFSNWSPERFPDRNGRYAERD